MIDLAAILNDEVNVPCHEQGPTIYLEKNKKIQIFYSEGILSIKAKISHQEISAYGVSVRKNGNAYLFIEKLKEAVFKKYPTVRDYSKHSEINIHSHYLPTFYEMEIWIEICNHKSINVPRLPKQTISYGSIDDVLCDSAHHYFVDRDVRPVHWDLLLLMIKSNYNHYKGLNITKIIKDIYGF